MPLDTPDSDLYLKRKNWGDEEEYPVIAALWSISESQPLAEIERVGKRKLLLHRTVATGRQQKEVSLEEKEYFLREKKRYAESVYDSALEYNPLFLKKLFEQVTHTLTPGEKYTVHIPLQSKNSNFDPEPKEAIRLDTNTLAIMTCVNVAEGLNTMAQAKGWNNLKFSVGDVEEAEKMNAKYGIREKTRFLIKEALSTDSRSTSNIIDRFVKQPKYNVSHKEASNIKEGDMLLLADDCVQAGGVTASMLTALEGCNVLGIAALSCLPETRTLKPPHELREGLDMALDYCVRIHNNGQTNSAQLDEYKKTLEEALGLVGLSMDSLTSREILMLMALFLDETHEEDITINGESCRQFFGHMKEVANFNSSIVEGEDSVKKNFRLKHLNNNKTTTTALTPQEFADQLSERIQQLTAAKDGSPQLEGMRR